MEEHLEHHGILGMKWGVRRYQNKDGSLTAAGKKRYLNSDGSYNDVAKKEIPKTALSIAELQNLTTRMRLEQEYDRLKGAKNERYERIAENIMKSLSSSVGKLTNSLVQKINQANAQNGKEPFTIDEKMINKILKDPTAFDSDTVNQMSSMVAKISATQKTLKDLGYNPSDKRGKHEKKENKKKIQT